MSHQYSISGRPEPGRLPARNRAELEGSGGPDPADLEIGPPSTPEFSTMRENVTFVDVLTLPL